MPEQSQDLIPVPLHRPAGGDQSLLSPADSWLNIEHINLLYRLSTTWARSGVLPSHLNTPEKVMTVAMMAQAVRVHPMVAFQTMFPVMGKIGMEAKLMLAMVLESGLCIDHDLYGDAKSATCMFHRRGRSKPYVETVTMEQVRQAKWHQSYDKDTKTWKDKHQWAAMPDLMLKWRAISRAARFVFPDRLLGIYTLDELDVATATNRAGEDEIVQPGATVVDGAVVVQALPEPTAGPLTELSQDIAAAVVARNAKPAPAPAPQKLKAEPVLDDPPTEATRDALKQLISMVQCDSQTPVFPPSERRELSKDLQANSTEKYYAEKLAGLKLVCEQRMQRFADNLAALKEQKEDQKAGDQ